MPKIAAAEKHRLQKICMFENEARKAGYEIIAGIDEAGRGPLAGPVVAAACIIPQGHFIAGVNDSKQLTEKQRENLYELIVNDSTLTYAVAIVDHLVIDAINIYQATVQAMLQAVATLAITPHYLLVDGLQLPHPDIPAQKIVSGDALSQSIAAASILAKVTRDRLMVSFHQQWPEYNFAKHKGYGTPEHMRAINQFGPCPIHRRSFAPIRESVEALAS